MSETPYTYKTSPFGLSPIPQLFTEMCTSLKVFAREKSGFVVFQYIDDWLFLSLDRARVAQAIRIFMRLCLQLGLIVNLQKSQLKTTQSQNSFRSTMGIRLSESESKTQKGSRVKRSLYASLSPQTLTSFTD